MIPVDTSYVIPGNFGNHSLAVMLELLNRGLKNLIFLTVDTGYASASWPARVDACTAYARSRGVQVHQLRAPADFPALVLERKQFPSPKFQWCAGFLKGLALTEWMDAFDPYGEAVVVSGKRRADSRRFMALPEFDRENTFWSGRTVWHPLLDMDDHAFSALISGSGFPVLGHPSEECSPCIHGISGQLDALSVARLADLEQQLGQTLFETPIREYAQTREEVLKTPGRKGCHLQQFDRACGAPWHCGE